MDWDVEIDAIGLRCPLPVLRLRKGLLRMQPGKIVRLLASDPMAELDIPHFCTESGHAFLGTEPANGGTAYLVRRGAGKP